MSGKRRDRDLGMGKKISRRDFLNGMSVAVGASILGANSGANSTWMRAFAAADYPFAPEKDPDYYPPRRPDYAAATMDHGKWRTVCAMAKMDRARG